MSPDRTSTKPTASSHRAPRGYLAVVGLVWAALLALGLLGHADPFFRPWERLTRDDAWTFTPGQRVEMRAVGDLARVRGVGALEHGREVVFSTDRWGFRNPDLPTLPDVVVVGDSYVAGSGMTDDDTVTARLSEHLGRPVYNYALETRAAATLLLMDGRFAEHPPRVVIFAPVARAAQPLPARMAPAPSRPEGLEAPAELLSRWLTGLQRDNGVSRLAVDTQQGLRYRFLGLPDMIYPDGEPALALTLAHQRLLTSAEERSAEGVVVSVLALAQALARRGTVLVFSPIPESGTIYPELFPLADRERLATPAFLDVVMSHVARAGVVTVDLRPTFRDHRSPYLYQRDDSHWGPLATDLAARVWAQVPAVRAAPR